MHYYPLGVLIVYWIIYIWDTYLSFRQYKVVLKTDKVPKELEEQFDEATLKKSKSYAIDKAKYGFLCNFFEQIQATLKIYYFIIPFFWNYSGQIMIKNLGLTETKTVEWEIFQSLVFVLITSIVCTIIGQPLSIYYHFVIEERHGFNKQTARFYVWDEIKKFVFSFALCAPIVVVTIYIVRFGGPYFFLYLWAFLAVVFGILMFFSGEIAALFDTVIPLPIGELRNRIEVLSNSIKFPLANIYLVKGSQRSSHSNAYQAGVFNRKRIVLYDTLLKGVPEGEEVNKDDEKKDDKDTKENTDNERPQKHMNYDEILGVVCHELGHWYHGHLWKNLIFAQANMFLMFKIFSMFYKDPSFYAAFGFTDEMPVVVGLTLLMMILTPYSELLNFMSVTMSRVFEYQADNYAKKQGYAKDLKTALVKLNTSNLTFPVIDHLYSKFNHSHPTVIERLKALDKTD